MSVTKAQLIGNVSGGAVFSGNVGIGTTTSPTTALDVNGDVTITDKIIHGGDTNTAIRFPAADTFTVETAGSERLRITSAGFVGIGTSAPSTPLHVAGSVRVGANDASNATLEIGGGATGNRNAFIDLVGDTTYSDYGFRIIRGDTGLNANSTINHRGTGNLTLATEEVAPISFNINLSERARIDSSGRILVGVSTARANLFNATVTATHQVEVTALSTAEYLGVRNTDNINGADLILAKSRGTTAGSNTIVQSGDSLGSVAFMGSDGTEFVAGGRIMCEVDGAVGINSMPGRLVFSTTAAGASTPTERMRITSDPLSSVLIGQTTNPATSRVVVQVQTGTANGVNAQITSNTGTSFPWGNYNASGTYVGGMSCTSTATSFPTSSDYRLKTNVQPLAGAISLVSQLKPSTFEFNENLGETVQGFIAHELQEVVSLAVIGEKDAEDANGNPIYQGVDAAKLVPLLTAALQEAVAEIKALKDRVTALETA